jgi:hypothetical protein
MSWVTFRIIRNVAVRTAYGSATNLKTLGGYDKRFTKEYLHTIDSLEQNYFKI